MTASDIQKLVWKQLSENAAVTFEEVMDAALAAGGSPAKVEGQIKGALRKLEIDQLITEQTDSRNSRFYVLSKKGTKKIEKEQRKLDAPERGDLYEAKVHIRLTLPSLAGSIPTDSSETGRMEWPRDTEGNIMLLPVWWKGLMRKVFERTNAIPRYVADWLMFDPVFVGAKTTWMKIPVPPAQPGQGGQGVNVHEVLPPGTEITLTGVYPGRAIPREQLENLWRLAGRVGFSVGKSKLGYGTFVVLECTILDDMKLDAEESQHSGMSLMA